MVTMTVGVVVGGGGLRSDHDKGGKHE